MFTRYLISLTLVLVSLLPASAQPLPEHTQTLFLLLHTDGQSVTVQQVIRKALSFRAPPQESSDPYRYTLLSQDNQTLYTQSFSDPLDIYVDDFSDPEHPRGGKERRAAAGFHLKAPDLTNAVRIRFERREGETWKPAGTAPLKP